jgi:hypothetical protein
MEQVTPIRQNKEKYSKVKQSAAAESFSAAALWLSQFEW